MKNKLRILTLAVVLLMVLCAFVGCGEQTSGGEVTKLSFKAASGYDYLKSLDGKQVSINGYMATSSPVDGSFIFLMNLPYQSCPFCVPNTSQLSNTMEIYPKKGESFGYTTQAIKVIGTLVVAEDESKPFTDMYGYEFNYKIVDATYTVLGADELSGNVALWQSIANSDVINEIYSMYDYVNFLCAWDGYYVNSFVNENGEQVTGYYLYAADAVNLVFKEGAQYNYGYKEGYFDNIVKKIEAVDPQAFSDLVANVRKAEALAEKALGQLVAEEYTYEYTYVEMFGTYDYVYTLNAGEELISEMETVYTEFAHWLGSWEM